MRDCQAIQKHVEKSVIATFNELVRCLNKMVYNTNKVCISVGTVYALMDI